MTTKRLEQKTALTELVGNERIWISDPNNLLAGAYTVEHTTPNILKPKQLFNVSNFTAKAPDALGYLNTKIAANATISYAMIFVDSNVELAANLTLSDKIILVPAGGIISNAGGFTFVNVQVFYDGNPRQIFNVNAAPALVRNFAYPEWWGASANDKTKSNQDAFNACINACRETKNYYIYKNIPYQRGFITIKMGYGLYRFTGSINIRGTGIILQGCGRESTMLVLDNSGTGDLFVFGDNVFMITDFRDFGVRSGEVVDSDDGLALSVVDDDLSTTATRAFFYKQGSGSTRFNNFTNIYCDGGFDYHFHIESDAGGGKSEIKFDNCNFTYSNTAFYSANSQTVNIFFNECTSENMGEYCFNLSAGGYLRVDGGSWICPGTFLYLNTAVEGVGIGSTNGHFQFNNVKWEMMHDVVPWPSPKLVDMASFTAATLVFNGCSNIGGGATASDPLGHIKCADVEFYNCSMLGIFETTPSNLLTTSDIYKFNSRSRIVFDTCVYTPTVTRNAQQGNYYSVTYKNCCGIQDKTLIGQRESEGSMCGTLNSMSYRRVFSGTSAVATIDFGENVVINDILVRTTRQNASASSLDFCIDSSYTVSLGTINIDTADANDKLHKITAITGKNLVASAYITDTLYVVYVQDSASPAAREDFLITYWNMPSVV